MIRRPPAGLWHPLVFGACGGGHVYVPRRAAYLVARDAQGRLACERGLRGGLYLVGGGLDAEECPEQALVREVAEEAAAAVERLRFVGVLREWFVAPDGAAYDQAGYFYDGRLAPAPGPRPDAFEWATQERFETEAVYASHVYATTMLVRAR